MKRPKSFLFVPGHNLERLLRSTRFGADAIVADLEDGVPDTHKSAALEIVSEWLAQSKKSRVEIYVRVNRSDRLEAEVRRISEHRSLRGIYLPKAESSSDVEYLNDLLSGIGSDAVIAPVIESAVGVMNMESVARAPRVSQLHLGELDLAADLGAAPERDGLEFTYARSKMVLVSRAIGLRAPAAPVSPVLDDMDYFRENSLSLRRMGFFGRDCIHPAQVRASNDVFTPSADERAWAAQIVAEGSGQGAYRHTDGMMVDEAVVRRARAILES